MGQALDLLRPCTKTQILAETRRLGITKNELADQLHISQKNIARWFQKGDYPNQFYNAMVHLVLDYQIWRRPTNEDYRTHPVIRRDGRRAEPSADSLMNGSKMKVIRLEKSE